MNKLVLSEKIAQDIRLPISTILKIIENITNTISKEVIEGREVTIVGFGSFRASTRVMPELNPFTKKPETNKTVRIVKFKPATKLKNALKDKDLST